MSLTSRTLSVAAALIVTGCVSHSRKPDCLLGSDLTLRGETYSNCQITGSATNHVGNTEKHVYFATCTNAKQDSLQLEFEDGSEAALIVDLITRETLASCTVATDKVAPLIQNYEQEFRTLDKPPFVTPEDF